MFNDDVGGRPILHHQSIRRHISGFFRIPIKPNPQTYQVAGEGRSGHSRWVQIFERSHGDDVNHHQALHNILRERAA